MRQIHPDVSLIPLLERIVATDVTIHLYANDVTPDRDTVLADLTEVDGAYGYTPITVDAAAFVLEGVYDHKGVLMALPVDFPTFNVLEDDAYGYYITDTGGTILLAVARLDGAPIDRVVGVPISVWPVFGDNSVFES